MSWLGELGTAPGLIETWGGGLGDPKRLNPKPSTPRDQLLNSSSRLPIPLWQGRAEGHWDAPLSGFVDFGASGFKASGFGGFRVPGSPVTYDAMDS